MFISGRRGSALRAWIAAQNPQHGAVFSQAFERALYSRVIAVTFEIGEESVLPELAAQRPRLDSREVQTLFVEDLEFDD